MILDVMLPKMTGLEICKRLRGDNSQLPIIMLTARVEDADKIVGLEIGADDYITKPFSMEELLFRIEAILRRTLGAKGKDKHIWEIGKLSFDSKKQLLRMIRQ